MVHHFWDCLWLLLPALSSACQAQMLWDCALTGEDNASTGTCFPIGNSWSLLFLETYTISFSSGILYFKDKNAHCSGSKKPSL